MEIKCSVEELIKIVSDKKSDTINIEHISLSNKIIEKLNQEKNQ